MFFIVVDKYKIWYWIKYSTLIVYLKQLKHQYVFDTQDCICHKKIWTMGGTVFTFAVDLPLGDFWVTQRISN